MGEGSHDPLRDLRDALRNPVPDIDTFTYLLSSTLREIGIHPTSVPSSSFSSNASGILRAIQRFLPTIQISLLTVSVPTFLHALEPSQQDLLRTFFVPPRQSDKGTLPLRRAIALSSYTTLTPLLASRTAQKGQSGQSFELSASSREFLLSTLESLALTYGIDELYWSVWGVSTEGESSRTASSRQLQWEEAVKTIIGLPGKVANAGGRWTGEGRVGDMPGSLVPKPYFDKMMVKLETLMYELSQSEMNTSSLRYVIQRLASNGLFPSLPSADTRSPSFWSPILPSLLAHLHPDPASPLPPYPSSYFPTLLLSLPTSTLSALVGSLLIHLSYHLPEEDLRPDKPNESVQIATQVLRDIIGPAVSGGEAMGAVMQVVLGLSGGKLNTSKEHALVRLIVAWVAMSKDQAVVPFIDAMMDAWTDPKYIRYALYAQQFNLTYTVLAAISLLPQYHPHLIATSHRPRFLAAMQSYLSHPDPAIRRLGMLVAEVISELTIRESAEHLEYSQQQEIDDLKAGLNADGDLDMSKKAPKGAKRLRFGALMWEGEGEGKEQARWLRSAVGVKDLDSVISVDHTKWLLGWNKDNYLPTSLKLVSATTVEGERGRKPTARPATRSKPQIRSAPKIVMLDDDQMADPLEGYEQNSPSSSRSPSPTPSFLEEVAADPSLALDAASKKKIQRPVYISQLLSLLKEREKPEHIEMALRHGEALVRAKRSFGTELAENSPALASMTVALNDPFNLDEFDEKRQGLLNALVACSPRNVAPYLVELYFIGQYSLQQRAVILTALAMGARESAGLSVPLPASTKKIDFPSKALPPALHRRYIGPNDRAPTPPDQIDQAVDGIRGLLLSKGARRGEETVPELAREKRLRVGSHKQTKIAEMGSLKERQMLNGNHQAQLPVAAFKDLATEYFIMPLINRFWEHFNDSSTRASRASLAGDTYHGAGTGMILNPMALEKYLMTLALLIHASRHSGTFLRIISPEALELAMTIGIRHAHRPQDHTLTNEDEGQDGKKEASVLGATLEICLVCLDASYELDGGRTLAMDKPELIMAVGEWASGVFKIEEGGGEKAAGQGGLREGRVRAAAAGVVVKVSDIGEKWGRLGIM